MPMKVDAYTDLLEKKVHEHKVNCWLVNTGWSGGGYGVGHRMPIEVSRSIVRQIVSGELASKKFVIHSYTSLSIPVQVNDVVDPYVVPEDSWENLRDYEKSCNNLLDLFEENLNN
jgi:phosphoenolpyruvate carboxykinase (ATP)